MQRFVKVNPAQNERRWYVVSWGLTLFGAWAVMRAWGRLGTNWSQRRVKEFATPEQARAEAEAQVQRREKRGYVAGGELFLIATFLANRDDFLQRDPPAPMPGPHSVASNARLIRTTEEH